MNSGMNPFILMLILLFFLAGLNAEDESCTIALNNLRTKVIRLRNEATEKDKILLSLVDKVKEDEASFKA
jgi:hypothetical protein